MKITKDYLRSRKACLKQTNLFVETFPDGADVTLDNLLTAADVGLNIDWLACRALSGSAWAAYRKVTARAFWGPCREATAPAWAAYRKSAARAFWDAWQIQQEQWK